MRLGTLAGVVLALAAPVTADAMVFHLTYTTSVDATSGPAQSLDALITADSSGYGDNGFFVTGISGTRGTQALTFNDNFDEIYYPSNSSGNYVDNFGLTFFAGSTLYQFYKGDGDFAYHEYDGSTGRIVFNTSVSLTPVSAVPEPESWAFMVVGLGLAGGMARTRKRTTTLAI